MTYLFGRRMAFAVLVAVLVALAASAVTAQGEDGAFTDNTRVPDMASPSGNVPTTTPGFVFNYATEPPTTFTYFRIQVLDGASMLFEQWYAVDDFCTPGIDDLTCTVYPEVVLHSGAGDKPLTWTLTEYDTVAGVGAPETYNFTIQAAQPLGPTIFSDLNGSPAFVMETLGMGEVSYQLFVRNAVTEEVVINEWVNVEGGDCPDLCETYLYPPYAPIYEEGTYELFTRAYLGGTFEDYSAWSEAFTFTVDYPANGPDNPTVDPFAVFTQSVADSVIFSNILDGENCLAGEGDTVICETSTPSIGFFVDDHQSQVQQIAIREALADGINLENARGFDEEYGIFNATQYFNVTVTDVQQNEVFNQWVNTYTDDQCISLIHLGGGSPIIREQLREPIDGEGVCLVDLPALADGDYTVTWTTYNPGGLPSDSFDLTIDLVAPPLDLETVNTPEISQVETERGEIVVELVWESDSFVPDWVNFVVTEAVAGEVYNEWLKAEYDVALEIELFDEIYSGGITVQDYNNSIYSIYIEQAVCSAGECIHVLPLNLTNGEYTVTIQTYTDAVSGMSDPIPFTIQNDPTTISEAVGEIDVMRVVDVEGNTRPTYKWVTTNNAQWTNLEVENSQGDLIVNDWMRTFLYCDTFDPDITLAEGEVVCEYQPAINIGAGSYEWRVRAWNSAGLGAYSSYQTLNISNAALTDPVPIAPAAAGNPHNGSPDFVFEAATNASWYQIQVTDSDDNAVVFDEWFYYPQSWCDGGIGNNECTIDITDDTQMAFELLSGNFTWQMRAANMGNVTDFTSSTAFTVENTNPGVPLISPDDEYTDGDITFYWLPSESSDYYGLSLWLLDPNNPLMSEPTREQLASGEFSEVAFSQWFIEEDLGEKCGIDFFGIPLRVAPQQRPAEFELPPVFCTYTIPSADLESGLYVWTVDAYGSTYGNEVLVNEEVFAFVKQ